MESFFIILKKDLKFNLDTLKEINENTSILYEQNDIFKYKFNYAIFELLSKKYSNKKFKNIGNLELLMVFFQNTYLTFFLNLKLRQLI